MLTLGRGFESMPGDVRRLAVTIATIYHSDCYKIEGTPTTYIEKLSTLLSIVTVNIFVSPPFLAVVATSLCGKNPGNEFLT